MSDFMIYLEENGSTPSTDWAFDNLTDVEFGLLMDAHMENYLSEGSNESL